MKVLYITHCTDLSGANNSMIQMITELRDNHGIIPFIIYPKIYQKGKNIENIILIIVTKLPPSFEYITLLYHMRLHKQNVI